MYHSGNGYDASRCMTHQFTANNCPKIGDCLAGGYSISYESFRECRYLSVIVVSKLGSEYEQPIPEGIFCISRVSQNSEPLTTTLFPRPRGTAWMKEEH